MADFKVSVCRLDEVSPHPNADRLDMARIGGWQIVVGKDQHKPGEIVAYIPEQSLVPEAVQKALGVEGKLAGAKKNRVKAIRLRGMLSQGLILPLKDGALAHPETGGQKSFALGDDAAEFLGIAKYEPPVPTHMQGEAFASPVRLPRYDVENWKSEPEAIPPGSNVLITEKLHGTLCLAVFHKEEVIISSKGMASKDMGLKPSENNLYHLVLTPFLPAVRAALEAKWPEAEARGIIGEIAGPRVQDLNYGLGRPGFYLFEIIVKRTPETPWEYGDFAEAQAFAAETKLNTVPFLGEAACPGPSEIDRANELADGKTAIPGSDQIREGVVLRAPKEGRDKNGDRLIRKIVSGAYLTRKKGTERR